MSRGHRHPPTSTVYVGAFVIASLVVFAVVGWWMLARMETIQTAAEQTVREGAQQELLEAHQRVLANVQEDARQFATWEETLQQLRDPTYYAYWRRNRALSRLPDYVHAIDLYDTHGTPLVELTNDRSMPDRLPERRLYLVAADNDSSLYIFIPVNRATDAGVSLAGYAGLKVAYFEALLGLNKFRYLDPSTLRIDTQGPTALPGLEEHLRFELLPQADTGHLEQLMRRTLLHFSLLVLALGIGYTLLTRQLLIQPLALLAHHVENLRQNRASLLSDDTRGGLPLAELEHLRRSINRYQDELAAMHASLDAKNDELWELAHHDPLTGVYNRRAYDEDWHHLLSLVGGRRSDVVIMLFDCDHFKAINDSYGHDIGDKVIQTVARLLAAALREGDRLYRLGGDEFAVQLIDTSAQEAQAIAHRCVEALRNHSFKELGIREPVRFSVGVSHTIGTRDRELAQLHKYADIAMYQAKRPGTGKIVVYEPQMADDAEVLVSSRYVDAVYQAIETGEGLAPHFQPVVALQSGKESFYEVLARIEDDEGLIHPGHIFQVVEGQHLESEFDRAMIRHVAERLEQGDLPAGTGLSLNLAAPSLLQAPVVEEALTRLGPQLENYRVMLEVTETALITEMWEASETLARLREAGFCIALDDFGSGYSSLRYLSSMPVDVVKFDIAMVHDLGRDDRHRLIVENVAEMILKAGYALVAEGVETPQMLERVRQLGFTHVQGFLIARPGPELVPLALPQTAQG